MPTPLGGLDRLQRQKPRALRTDFPRFANSEASLFPWDSQIDGELKVELIFSDPRNPSDQGCKFAAADDQVTMIISMEE